MHKYGINDIVLYESEREIDDVWLAALGAANVIKLDANIKILNRAETTLKINAKLIRVEMTGHVDVYATRHKTPQLELGNERIFMSDDDLCITATKTTVPTPLKPSASVKQAAGKKQLIQLTVCQMNKTKSARQVKVTGHGKHNYSGTVPISCW